MNHSIQFLSSLLLPAYLCIAPVLAQQTAFFETTIYVEDAVGNIDSVVIGHDPEANYFYNPQFGEYDIPEPFDSVLEVRAAHWFSYLWPDMILSKKVIGGIEIPLDQEYQCYQGSEPVLLFIHALNQPVTVRWDREQFDNSVCRKGTVLTSHYLPTIYWFWHLDSAFLALSACMAEVESYTQNLINLEWGAYITKEINGIGPDTIFSMLITHFGIGWENTPCEGTVSIPPSASSENDTVVIYPNPGRDLVFIGSEVALYRYEIYDIRGYLLTTGSSYTIDLTRLSAGIYFVSITLIDGNKKVHRIVKL